MGINLTVDNTTYNYPTAGQEPGYGEDATGWAKAVTDVLNSLAGSGTINETQSIIENNKTSNTTIPGLQFSSALTQSAVVLYRIFRDTDSISPMIEQGKIDVLYDNGTWKISREIVVGSPAGIVMDIDSLGQVVYTSTNLAGANYVGFIKFKTIGIIS